MPHQASSDRDPAAVVAVVAEELLCSMVEMYLLIAFINAITSSLSAVEMPEGDDAELDGVESEEARLESSSVLNPPGGGPGGGPWGGARLGMADTKSLSVRLPLPVVSS